MFYNVHMFDLWGLPDGSSAPHNIGSLGICNQRESWNTDFQRRLYNWWMVSYMCCLSNMQVSAVLISKSYNWIEFITLVLSRIACPAYFQDFAQESLNKKLTEGRLRTVSLSSCREYKKTSKPFLTLSPSIDDADFCLQFIRNTWLKLTMSYAYARASF